MTNRAKRRRAIITAIEGVIIATGMIGGMAVIGFAVVMICRAWGC